MEVAAFSLSELVRALKADECTTLHACENQIGDHGSEQVAVALASNSSVITLRLNDNDIGDVGAGLLAEALQQNQCMLTVSMTRNRIGPPGGADLGTLLRSNACLTRLDLAQNSLGDEGAMNLAQGLATSRRLLSLDLQCNRISGGGAAALAEAISHGIPLRELHLRDNQIDDVGVDPVAHALESSNLVLLDLSFNRITRSGLLVLIQGVETSSTLTCLSLQHLSTDRHRDDLTRLDNALQKNKQTMVLTVNILQDVEKLHVSCTNMSGCSILKIETPDVSLQQLYILLADAVGQPSQLHLIDAAGQLLPDSPDLLSEYFGLALTKR
eukprot:Skav229596  [mRNA]  locus=scaffold510:194243:195223:+ [translate_table: standard]